MLNGLDLLARAMIPIVTQRLHCHLFLSAADPAGTVPAARRSDADPAARRRSPAPSGSSETAERLPGRNRDESPANQVHRKSPVAGALSVAGRKPDSVVGSHPSGTPVAERLERPTWDWASNPWRPGLALHQVGFTQPACHQTAGAVFPPLFPVAAV